MTKDINRLGKDWYVLHGHEGEKNWSAPVWVTRSNEANRADQGNTTLAHEYLDEPDVLRLKVKKLAALIRASRCCTAYTGAGLSKSAGIPDYATKAKDSIVKNAPKLRSSLDALPTLAHYVLTDMERKDLLHHYVQQNHDGLPQKAGFPQEKINEIHGAWFDPSNPVVPFSGSLRGDLFDWMLEMEEKTDLCLCLGTSLSGMNADRMANTPAKKYMKGQKGILGTVLINLQQTPLDHQCTLRIWAKLDDVFTLLAQELELPLPDMKHPPLPGWLADEMTDVFAVPYDEEGNLDKACKMTLDLRPGAWVQIVPEDSMYSGALGVIRGKNRQGHYIVELKEQKRRYVLGAWWAELAQKGRMDQLPLINLEPELKQVSPDFWEETTSVREAQPPEKIQIIQSYESVSAKKHVDNVHRWGLRLEEGAEQWVESVQWHLHPTFQPDAVACSSVPFAISRVGWGTFDVQAEIRLKPEASGGESKVIKASHTLRFENEGESAFTTEVPLS